MANDSDPGFQARADELLLRLATVAEEQLSDAEIEQTGGVLEIELDGKTYVINRHAPTLQVWLSSPVSGAWHFSWDAATKRWLDTRQKRDLLPMLAEEWSQLSAAKISFDC